MITSMAFHPRSFFLGVILGLALVVLGQFATTLISADWQASSTPIYRESSIARSDLLGSGR